MRNIEIKARPRDWARIEAALTDLGADDAGPEAQTDIFFACTNGRLKLRLSSRTGATLIHYRREDAARVRPSEYSLVAVEDSAGLGRMLAAACGVRAEVRKERRLWLLDNVRVHDDRVDGLGRFLEIEAVVDAAHPEAECRTRTAELLQRFGIAPEDCIASAYVDLLPR